MRVGCPKEIKVHEYRVGLTPESAAELVRAGHEVFLETKAGEGIGAPDSVYEKVGVSSRAELVAKVYADHSELIAKARYDAYAQLAAMKVTSPNGNGSAASEAPAAPAS